MISYFNENFRHPKLVFDHIDITNQSDVNKLIHKHGQFDHVISLFSLHWVMDQELAFRNIFDLLTPNGDILITMCQDHPIYEHYTDTLTLEKWSDYSQQIKMSTSPYFGLADPVKMLKETLEKAGFKYVQVDLKERLYQYDKEVFINATSPNAPLLCEVSESLRREFLSTYEHKVMRLPLNRDQMQNNRKIGVAYRVLNAYAKKGNFTPDIITNNSYQTPSVLSSDEVRMHNAKCYHETNCMQRKDALDTIMEYQNRLEWTPKADDSLLDIGIGSGDVTYDYILPVIPEKAQIIASDKSLEMLNYARQNFSHPRIVYEKLDIESENDVNELLRKFGQVNHVTSFCCLHWALKQYVVMENIFHLLQPGGDLLMTICQHHPLYEHYADMSEVLRWSKYRPDMKKSTSPYFRNDDPQRELHMRLERAGFVDINVILKRRIHPFECQVFIDSTVPVAPFLDKISESLKDEFLQIYINKVMTMKLPAPYDTNQERNDGKTIVPFSMLVAYARKPGSEDTRV